MKLFSHKLPCRRVVSVKTIGCKIDFVENSIAETTVLFFIIILDFIFTRSIQIEIFEKKTFFLKTDSQFSRIAGFLPFNI